MSLLSKDQILAAQDIRFETVAVPEWGGEVRIRSMTAADRDDYEQWLIEQTGGDTSKRLYNMRARLVALAIVSEDGERLFNDDDVAALCKKSASAMGRIFDAAMALNAIAAKDVEALAKN